VGRVAAFEVECRWRSRDSESRSISLGGLMDIDFDGVVLERRQRPAKINVEPEQGTPADS
jgi:hypothetical protein